LRYLTARWMEASTTTTAQHQVGISRRWITMLLYLSEPNRGGGHTNKSSRSVNRAGRQSRHA
jgi:hypothetical protein